MKVYSSINAMSAINGGQVVSPPYYPSVDDFNSVNREGLCAGALAIGAGCLAIGGFAVAALCAGFFAAACM